VYKVYGAGPDWYRDEIRLSLPHAQMTSKDAYQFDTQKPFPLEQFTQYSPTLNRMVKAKTDAFFKVFVKETNLNLFGVDIIVDERDGRHLIVDCNYFSSYAKIKNPELVEQFDNLILEKHRQNEEQAKTKATATLGPRGNVMLWILGVGVATVALRYF